MTRAECLAELEESAFRIVKAFTELGVVACFIHELENTTDIRLTMPDTLLIRPMLERAVSELESRESEHRC